MLFALMFNILSKITAVDFYNKISMAIHELNVNIKLKSLVNCN